MHSEHMCPDTAACVGEGTVTLVEVGVGIAGRVAGFGEEGCVLHWRVGESRQSVLHGVSVVNEHWVAPLD